MAKTDEKGLIRSALEGISKGDVRTLKKLVNETLLSKIKRALYEKEKQIAKELTKTKK